MPVSDHPSQSAARGAGGEALSGWELTYSDGVLPHGGSLGEELREGRLHTGAITGIDAQVSERRLLLIWGERSQCGHEPADGRTHGACHSG